MSDHRCQINFSCEWREAFLFLQNSLLKISANINHPISGEAYYFPADGGDRILFDAKESYLDGGVQFWLNSVVDIYVSWRPVSEGYRFDIDLKGKDLKTQASIVEVIYVSLRKTGQELVGDGVIFGVVFFD